MRLIEIEGMWVNPDRVDAVTNQTDFAGTVTGIYTSGSKDPFIVGVPIEDVVAKLTGASKAEESFMGVPMSELDRPENAEVKQDYEEWLKRHSYLQTVRLND